MRAVTYTLPPDVITPGQRQPVEAATSEGHVRVTYVFAGLPGSVDLAVPDLSEYRDGRTAKLAANYAAAEHLGQSQDRITVRTVQILPR